MWVGNLFKRRTSETRVDNESRQIASTKTSCQSKKLKLIGIIKRIYIARIKFTCPSPISSSISSKSPLLLDEWVLGFPPVIFGEEDKPNLYLITKSKNIWSPNNENI